MEEYEVDLRDYFRVMWERKWIILGVFLVAVLAAAAYSFSLPDEYEARALVRLEQKPPIRDLTLELPSAKTITELLRQPEIWMRSLELFPPEDSLSPLGPQEDRMRAAQELAKGFSAQILGDSPFLSLRLRGSYTPEQMQTLLARHIVAVQTLLRDQIREEIEQQLAALEEQERFYNRRREELVDELQRWMDSRLASLNAQRADLLRKIEDLLTKQEDSGETALQGEILQQSYAALTAQLQAVEAEIIRLETEKRSRYPQPGSGVDLQLQEIDQALQQLALQKDLYRQLLEQNWIPFRSVGEVRASSYPVGPPRQLNLAVAGVLGLFVGVLLAFFVNYLQSEPSRPEPQRQPHSQSQSQPQVPPEEMHRARE